VRKGDFGEIKKIKNHGAGPWLSSVSLSYTISEYGRKKLKDGDSNDRFIEENGSRRGKKKMSDLDYNTQDVYEGLHLSHQQKLATGEYEEEAEFLKSRRYLDPEYVLREMVAIEHGREKTSFHAKLKADLSQMVERQVALANRRYQEIYDRMTDPEKKKAAEALLLQAHRQAEDLQAHIVLLEKEIAGING